jgi:hypothetical protein
MLDTTYLSIIHGHGSTHKETVGVEFFRNVKSDGTLLQVGVDGIKRLN